MFHLYSLEVSAHYSKATVVKVTASVAKLFDEETSSWVGETSADCGPFNKIFKVSARTRNEADVKVEDRSIRWIDKLNNRFVNWEFFHAGLTYLGESET